LKTGPRAILGFNAHIHDTAAALLVDGRTAAFIEEERPRREKHTTAFPELAIAQCLRQAGLTIADLSGVAFYWRPWVGLGRRIGQTICGLPATLVNFRRMQGQNFLRMLTVRADFARRYGYRGKFWRVLHHIAHAYHGAFHSPFERALVLIIDGNGEIASTLVAALEGERIHPLSWTYYPHSLGLLWCTVTEWMGYRQNCDEGKVMGLAPYGDDSLVRAMESIIEYKGQGRFRMQMDWFDYHRDRSHWYGPRWARTFGAARRPEEPLEDRHRAVAHALQAATEKMVLTIIEDMSRKLGVRDLVLSGGVALNCVMNGRIAGSGLVDGLYIPPAAYDAGAALGAAMYVDREVFDQRRREVEPAPFLGTSFDDEAYEAALAGAGVKYEKAGEISRRTAQLLAAGKIVGWFQGRQECGPRALGHRSILADPRPAEMKDRVNARVKHREAYRPFGPSVLAECAHEVFETQGRLSPYMLLAFKVRPEWAPRIPAVVHVDGTSRIQTVSAQTQPTYHALIQAFAELTGVPLVLNTSFNVMGEPIVNTPADAIACYLSTGLDALVLGDYLAVKD